MKRKFEAAFGSASKWIHRMRFGVFFGALTLSPYAHACHFFPESYCTNQDAGHVAVNPYFQYRSKGGLAVEYKCCIYHGTQASFCDGVAGMTEWTGTSLYCDGSAPDPKMQLPIEKTACATGSIIGIDQQTLSESVPIVGTSFYLSYSTKNQPGYLAKNQTQIVYFDSTVSTSATSVDSVIKLGNQTVSTTYAASPNLKTTFAWNGLNASNQISRFSQSGTVTRTYHGTESPGAGQFWVNDSDPVTNAIVIGGFNAELIGLGGWQLSIHHAYDFNRKVLEKGDGSSAILSSQEDGSNFDVISEDGTEIYVFDSNGIHRSTKTSVTGSTKYTFSYNTVGQLTTVTDAFSNVTSITYSSGLPVRITAPRGQITAIGGTSTNPVASINAPGFGMFSMTYYSGTRLLKTFTKPSGEVSSLTHDSLGRLTMDSSTAGPSSSLSRLETDIQNWTVVLTTNLGRKETVAVSQDSSRQTTRTTTNSSGSQNYYYSLPTSSAVEQDESGGQTNTYYSKDPRFSSAWYASSIWNQASTTRSVAVSKTASLNSSSPIDVNTLSTSVTVNSGAPWVTNYSGSTKTYTTTTPVGRVSTRTTDTNERTTQTKFASFSPVNFVYDAFGRPYTATQSSRTSKLEYNPQGFLKSVTNPMSQVTSMTYDDAGRVLTTTLPDTRVIAYSYDSVGNITSVTPPSSPVHSFTNNLMNFPTLYKAPSLGSGTLNTSYVYSNDRELTQVTRPGGAVINFNYNSTTGLLDSVTSGTSSFSYTYASDEVYQATSPDGVSSTTINYPGPKPLSAEYTGGALGKVTYSYDSMDRPGTFQIGTGTAYAFGYDNDELLTSVGSETINRGPSTGLVSDTSIGNAKEVYSYDATYGELASYQAKYSTSNKINEVYTRDANGRISTRVITVGTGTASTYVYTYDPAGRLTDVTRNGAAFAHYVYDANSNRTSSMNSAGTLSATYDAEDRLITYGPRTYGYTLNGERTSKVDSSTSPTTTTYTWDAFGNLKRVTLPSATQINYQYDGFNRKVTKLNGTAVTERYVYLDQTRLLGVLNSSGSTVMTFFYGERRTPEYMIKSGTTYKFFVDFAGSVRQVVNTSTGTVAQEITYDEFGRILSDSSPGFQPFGFAGGLYDSATGLVQFGARWYDPQVGGWISKDPSLFAGGLNLYGYSFNDPVNFRDTNGKNPYLIAGAIIGVGGVVGSGSSFLGTLAGGGSIHDANQTLGPGFVAGASATTAALGATLIGFETAPAVLIGAGVDAVVTLGHAGYSLPSGSERNFRTGLESIFGNQKQHSNKCE